MTPPPNQTSRLVVDVADLLEHPGTQKRIALREWVPGLENELVRVDANDPLEFDLTLESVDEGGVLVRGSMHGSYVASCRRCLEEVRRPFTVSAAEVYRPRSAGLWEEGYAIENETVDLDRMVRDNVLLTMPLYPLCSDECLGLCSRCGGNVGRGECSCVPQEHDDRWSQLRSLLADGDR